MQTNAVWKDKSQVSELVVLRYKSQDCYKYKIGLNFESIYFYCDYIKIKRSQSVEIKHNLQMSSYRLIYLSFIPLF